MAQQSVNETEIKITVTTSGILTKGQQLEMLQQFGERLQGYSNTPPDYMSGAMLNLKLAEDAYIGMDPAAEDADKTVWVVTAGRYSDQEQVGVFSTEEKAKEYIGNFIDDYSYEEIPFDSMEKRKVTGGAYLRMDFLKNEVMSHQPLNDVYGYNLDEVCIVAVAGITSAAIVLPYYDREKALKTFSEIRARLLALDRIETGSYNKNTLEKIE